MRRHAKPATAGTSQRRENGLGKTREAGDIGTTPVASTGSGAPNKPRLVLLVLAAFAFTVALGVAIASSKEVVTYFGTESGSGSLGGEFNQPRDIGVNRTGAGPADAGDIYVADDNNHRVERFDAEGNFISAWGADVDATPSGGSDFEICTVAADCKAGVASGGNATAAGNGALDNPQSVAVDGDTGQVYVADRDNRRVSVYDGEGAFLRAFGFDVAESGTGNTGVGYEICTAIDVCKAGVAGAEAGQIGSTGTAGTLGIAVSQPDGESAVGKVFLADSQNRRVNTYGLDGSSPASIGSATNFGTVQPRKVAVDSRGILYASDSNSGPEIDRYDTENANGGGVGFLASIPSPPLLAGPAATATSGLAVKPDTDGAGPDTDVLYVLRDPSSGATVVQQFGPTNEPGLTAAPSAVDAVHGEGAGFGQVNGLGLSADAEELLIGATTGGHRVYVLDDVTPATAAIDSIGEVTSASAEIEGTIDPNGSPEVSYHLEYSSNGGSSWSSTPSVTLGSQETPQSVSVTLEPEPFGLQPNTTYTVRLAATRPFNATVLSAEESFSTLAQAPGVETAGAPVRTATTAQLNGRVNPYNKATAYRFEYGETTSYGQTSPPQSAGSGGLIRLVAGEISGLEPDTTYHYRLVADNGEVVAGEDMTVRTRASDAALEHGSLPGPPGSDRAWEHATAPDTGGNPVAGATAISDNGDRVVYRILGGSPGSKIGSFFNQLLSERTDSGWKVRSIYPPRSEAQENLWFEPAATDDLSELVATNYSTTGGEVSSWRMAPGEAATKILGFDRPEWSEFIAVSDDTSRVVAALRGSQDLEHPVGAGAAHLYDITSGAPRMLSLLPSGGPPACGVTELLAPLEQNRTSHYVTADGVFAFFATEGDTCAGSNRQQVYARDIPGGATTRMSPVPVSGPECEASFIRATDDAAFFYSASRLVGEDSEPASCNAATGDVYRFELDSQTLSCATCVLPGVDAAVDFGASPLGIKYVSVADDGVRIYFRSKKTLVPGALANGFYRVNLETEDLAYIMGSLLRYPGDFAIESTDLNDAGTVLVFKADGSALNPIGGQDNGGTEQYYRYDDRDRTLLCVSCPQDGSQPTAAVKGTSVSGMLESQQLGPNVTAVNDDGTFVFNTPTPLVSEDQNTVPSRPLGGTDVYEWRDGRVLLVSDGLTSWPTNGAEFQGPMAAGITPSGRDLFFLSPAQYTRDALDTYPRLYDARIGGGFEFPDPPEPCALEVCQGTPEGAPTPRVPNTETFQGGGNPRVLPSFARCRRAALGARRYSQRAKRLRRAARRSAGARRSLVLRRRAAKLAQRAKRRSAAAKRCRLRVRRTRNNQGPAR